ncbi:NU5M oxidoreductase, partial [Acromyrmex charruanus]
ISILFIRFIILISAIIILYRIVYISLEKYINRFNYLLLLFTLVTAGVYLMIRFNRFLMETNVNIILGFFSIVTIFIMANFENDFKKIIALSTLSQLGLIIIILAIFKSMLFMTAGAVTHSVKSTQDIRLLGNLNEIIPYVIIRLLISNIALKSVPFINYKDNYKDIYRKRGVNIFIFILIILSLLLNVSYSVRLFYYLFINRRLKLYRYMNIKEDRLINVSIIIRCTTLFPPFFFRNSRLYCKKLVIHL